MELFLLSIVAVAVAEIGDRSMFLAALFGMRCRSAWVVFWGMAAGLFLNQLVSALAGIWLFAVIATNWHLWLVGTAFLVMAVWVLIPASLASRYCFSGDGCLGTDPGIFG